MNYSRINEDQQIRIDFLLNFLKHVTRKFYELTFFRCFWHVPRRWTFRRTELILRRYKIHHYRLLLLRIPLFIFKIPLITLHSILRIESHTLPPSNIRTRFLRNHGFSSSLFFFYSFLKIFLIKCTIVSNEMELDNFIYLRMSFHYRKLILKGCFRKQKK